MSKDQEEKSAEDGAVMPDPPGRDTPVVPPPTDESATASRTPRRPSFIGRSLSGSYIKRDSMFTFKRSESDFFKGSPSVPPPSGVTEIVLRAPTEMRFLLVGLLFSVAVFTWFYWVELGVVNQKMVLAAILLVFVWTVDYFQKKYVFRGDRVARRILFRWSLIQLPPSFTVHREPSGAIVITDDHDDGVIMVIGRDMVNPEMAKALKELYQYAAESTFEIG